MNMNADINLIAPERALTVEDSNAMFLANHDMNVLMRHSDAAGVSFSIDVSQTVEIDEDFVNDIFWSLSEPMCENISVNFSESQVGDNAVELFKSTAVKYGVTLNIL